MAAEKLIKSLPLNESHPHTTLVKDCLTGDRKAQYRLYRLYNKAMFNTCLRMLNSREDAEDVLQNSFVDVFMKLHMYRGDATIGAWIKRIVINNCINFLKKKRIAITELKSDRVASIPETKESELQLDVTKLNEALSSLPNGYRIVFTLYAIEGYDHQEIADIIGTSVSTSKSQYSRAKKKLKDLLNDRQQLLQQP